MFLRKKIHQLPCVAGIPEWLLRDRRKAHAQRPLAWCLCAVRDRQRPLRGDTRIQLAQAARSGVAWVGEGLLPQVALALVELLEHDALVQGMLVDDDQALRQALQDRCEPFFGYSPGFDAAAVDISGQEPEAIDGEQTRRVVAQLVEALATVE